MDRRSDPTIDLGPPVPVRIEPLPTDCLVSGHWYLAWRCRCCGSVVPVEDDPTCGAIRVRLGGRGVVYFTCRSCGSSEVQTGSECLQYQRASDASQRDRIVDRHTGTTASTWGPRMTPAEQMFQRTSVSLDRAITAEIQPRLLVEVDRKIDDGQRLIDDMRKIIASRAATGADTADAEASLACMHQAMAVLARLRTGVHETA